MSNKRNKTGAAATGTTTTEQPQGETKQLQPSTAMIALFQKPSGIDLSDKSKVNRLNMPQMIKPGDVPIGAIVSGKLLKVLDSPVSTVKGKLLWLQHESGQEFTFPATGVIRNALAPGVTGDGKELNTALEKFIGETIVAKRLENKPSKYKKEMFMFDVFTVKQ